jgi:1-deoxy-D-xylulose-5-phosphate reductoisomerase
MTESIGLLGSTGSIGTQVLEVVSRFPDRFRITSLAAGDNLDRLASQIKEFQPQRVCIKNAQRRDELQRLVPHFKGEILSGDAGLCDLGEDPESQTLIVGLVGMIGLAPTLKAMAAGKKILTANKETFVAGGHLVAPGLEQILPIDSEHAAIHQCLKGEPARSVQTLYLTASGGPFRNHTPAQLATVTRADALKHPNWVMGPKITIDSATMMNKGLEVIEAHWLFGVPYEQIQILIHPQSILHSGVEFCDGSILMQMGAPDMRVPIQYAMGYPQRLDAEFPNSRLNLLSLSALDFQPPDPDRFPCIRLAYEAGRLGSSATVVLNAADEVAVQLFLEDRITFLQIPTLIERALEAHTTEGLNSHPSLEDLLALDAQTRRQVLAWGQAPAPVTR